MLLLLYSIVIADRAAATEPLQLSRCNYVESRCSIEGALCSRNMGHGRHDTFLGHNAPVSEPPNLTDAECHNKSRLQCD